MTILNQVNMGSLDEIESKEDMINFLKNLLILAKNAQTMYKPKFDIDELIEEYGISSKEDEETIRFLFNDTLNKKEHDVLNESFSKTIDTVLSHDDEDTQIKKLKIFIENIICSDEGNEKSDQEETEIGESNSKKFKDTMDYIKGYYQEALEKIEKLENKNWDEERIISMYENSKELNIHVDNEIENGYIYGDLAKKGIDADLVLYKDENLILKRISNYQTGKSKKIDRKTIVAQFSPEEISKYQFDVAYEKGKTATMYFFAEPKVGDGVLEGRKRAFISLIAAACEAKKQGRQFAGRISCIGRDTGTYITTFDDNLEEAVKNLLIKEQKEEEMAKNKENSVSHKEDPKKGGEQPEGKE